MKRQEYHYTNRRNLNAPRYYRPHQLTPLSSAGLPEVRSRGYWKIFLFLGFLLLLLSVLGFYAFTLFHSSQLKSQDKQAESVASSINTILAQNSQYQIGVALVNISSGSLQTFGETSPFEAASTAKVLTACAYYHLVETGKASLNTPMGNYTANFQLKQMINQSNNDSWTLLTGSIGDVNLQNYADSISGVEYNEATNTLSPSSMATLLEKLYQGKLLNKEHTNQLLSYMQHTNDEDLIPAAIPEDVTIYHKYGLLNGELHDASILTKGNLSYSLVIYTKSTDDSDDDARTNVIHQLTQTIISQIFS